MTAAALVAALDEAKDLATRGEPVPEAVTDLVLRILTEASDTPVVLDALKGATAGRALLRMTDGTRAIELQAGDGTLFAEIAEPKAKGPKVDASAATWLGLLGGTLKPWLAFTRGMVIARAGLTELRWMQQTAERLQRGYDEARRLESAR
ncbi:MAG TPA: hypothetical protein VL333_12135 [Candidatus Saccharimonadales bacterium]|jgi:hypothetical protein|nr:hypothetical protein [Candidatus Saccharimonadales bacterium]